MKPSGYVTLCLTSMTDDMGSITGNENLTSMTDDVGSITGNKETINTKSITVNGSQFGHEEGGWRRDRDNGQLCGGFLFIAFCEGFDLFLTVTIDGNSNSNYSLEVRKKGLKEFGIKDVVITEDEIDISDLFSD